MVETEVEERFYILVIVIDCLYNLLFFFFNCSILLNWIVYKIIMVESAWSEKSGYSILKMSIEISSFVIQRFSQICAES